MEKFTKEIVEKYADDLLIGLTSEENKMVLEEFSKIDDDIGHINEIDGISKVEPMTHCLDDFVYELREDVVEEIPSIDDLLANCKDYDGREVRVVRVVKKNDV